MAIVIRPLTLATVDTWGSTASLRSLDDWGDLEPRQTPLESYGDGLGAIARAQLI